MNKKVTKKKAAKKTVKKAVKKSVVAKEQDIVLKDGAYFTAKKNGKEFSGTVSYYDGDTYAYLNNNSFDTESNDVVDNDNFFHAISVKMLEWNGSFTEEKEIPVKDAMKREGITDFKIVKDKATIKKIENSKVPETIAGENVSRDGDWISFGCGAIEVTKKELELFVKYAERKKTKEELSFEDLVRDIENQDHDLDEININDVKKLIAALN